MFINEHYTDIYNTDTYKIRKEDAIPILKDFNIEVTSTNIKEKIKTNLAIIKNIHMYIISNTNYKSAYLIDFNT